MRYEVISSGHTDKAPDAIAQLQERVNQALAEGAQLAGGVSVVWGRSSRTFGKMGRQAFQAILIPD